MKLKVSVYSKHGYPSHPLFNSDGIGGIFSALAFAMNIISSENRTTDEYTIVINREGD